MNVELIEDKLSSQPTIWQRVHKILRGEFGPAVGRLKLLVEELIN